MLDFHPQSTKTNIGEAVAYFTRMMKRRTTAFVISDFYDNKDFLKQFQIANSKHDLMAVQVYDRWAKQLPDVGLMKVQDAETGSEMYIDTSSKKVRAAHARYWTVREAILRETFSQANVDWMSVATDEDFVKAMMTLFSSRNS